MPYIVPSNVAVQVENPPDEWLNGLSVYSTSEGADEMLDLYRRLVNSNDYYWMGVPVPTGTNINIPGYQGYEAGVSVPPGSYIISLTGSSSDPAGFKFSLSDKGSKLQLTEKTFIQSNLILGNEFPVSGGLVEDNPFGPYLLKSPLVVMEPGQLQVQITNMAADTAIIQILIGIAVPVTAHNISVIQVGAN